MTQASYRTRARARILTAAILALTSILALAHTPPAAAQQGSGMWSEIEFPDQIGSLNFDDKMVYGGATHGVTARYLGDQRVATISIYDRGLTDVPNDIGAGVVRDAFAKACRDLESGVAQGAYRKVAFRDSSETVVRLPWREMRFLRATFDVELADSDPKLVTEMTTHIFLTVVDGVFHRERYSHPADITGDAEANRALEDFAGSIALRYLDRDWSSEDDFRRAQPEIRRVAQWLADDPRYPPDSLRATVAAHVLEWIMRTPYLETPVDTGHLALALKDGDCECDDFVTVMYKIGCGLHMMDSPTSTPASARRAGMEFALDAQAKLAAGGGKFTTCAGLSPLARAREAGTLESMLED